MQLVALVGTGVGEAVPNTTLPAVTTCTFFVTLFEPDAMTNPAPAAPPVEPSQFTVMPAPVALSVPLTPPV